MILIQLLPPLKFWLVPPPIKTHRTLARAISLFKVGAERRTTGRTGILIYLSMRERRAQIIADEAIASKVPAEMWGEAMAAMLAHIKDGRVADGMCAAVEKVGVVLAAHFPPAEDDVNELPDRLIEL
jgi:putative membrane protein